MHTSTRQHRNPYVHRSCIASTCASCGGTGRAIRTVRRCRSIDCGTVELDIRCETCDGYGETYRSEFATIDPEPAGPAPTGQPITWGGHDVDAPGFSQDQFERAMARAFADDLRVKQLRDGGYVVHHAGVTHGYRVSRERCTCRAGEVGTPCKHRAVLIAHLDIRIPHVDRQWRKLQAERPALASA